MEAVSHDLSDYLSSEGLSDMMPAGSGLHGGQAGLDGTTSTGCPSNPMHAWHDPQLASQYETYDADQSQGYDITGCVHPGYAQDLAQVASNDETIPSEDQCRTHSSAGTLEPSEAGIGSVASQQVLGSTVSQTETDLDVSKLGPEELKVLVPDQTCRCAACLSANETPHPELRFALRGQASMWIGRTLSCRVTGCQWTTKDEPRLYWTLNLYEALHHHEAFGRAEHYGKSGEWRCREIDCKFVTKRWNDFLRHSTSKHCIKPRDLKCPFLECKYHHVDFSRKDKLKSHVEKVHKGIPHPAKPIQAIKPKVTDHA